LLLWLRERLQALGYNTTRPETEDWGWYVYSERGASSYLVGASGDPESGSDIHWMIQIHKERSLRDKMFGRNKLASNDELSEAVEWLVRGEKDFRNPSVKKNKQRTEYSRLHRVFVRIGRRYAICRRLISLPGVGAAIGSNVHVPFWHL